MTIRRNCANDGRAACVGALHASAMAAPAAFAQESEADEGDAVT
jgi:hypothetical protein